MKRYTVHLLILSLVALLGYFATLWFHMEFFAILPALAMPLLVLYFAVVDAMQYWVTMRSVNQSPKTFVQSFLALSVGVLFLHMGVLIVGMFAIGPLTEVTLQKHFIIGFLIYYVVFTTFIITELVLTVKKFQKVDN